MIRSNGAYVKADISPIVAGNDPTILGKDFVLSKLAVKENRLPKGSSGSGHRLHEYAEM